MDLRENAEDVDEVVDVGAGEGEGKEVLLAGEVSAPSPFQLVFG